MAFDAMSTMQETTGFCKEKVLIDEEKMPQFFRNGGSNRDGILPKAKALRRSKKKARVAGRTF